MKNIYIYIHTVFYLMKSHHKKRHTHTHTSEQTSYKVPPQYSSKRTSLVQSTSAAKCLVQTWFRHALYNPLNKQTYKGFVQPTQTGSHKVHHSHNSLKSGSSLYKPRTSDVQATYKRSCKDSMFCALACRTKLLYKVDKQGHCTRSSYKPS